ncbi:MAG: acyl-CoA dehydrogenase family protein, partial [Actinomycetota bacterium]|nr:acyl-CoA dehydrogenase family protein [Actinomycetota bacterium]
MSFNLTAEQERLAAQVRERARVELVPVADAGRTRRVNRELLKALGELGLSQRLFPRSAGGSREEDVSAMELCLLREALAAECTAAETALALQGLGSYPILQSGSPEMFGRWLPPVARGGAVAAFALTEPGAGSDAAAIALSAERDGDAWRLSGSKKWISNAPDADVYVVFARTSPGARSRGVTAFVVSGDSAGLSGTHLELLGDHPIGSLEFDAVRVPAECVLGEVDRGFQVAMRTLFLFRPSVGAAAVGMAQAAVDAAAEHARARRAFGRELREFQAVSHRLAEMTTRLQAARLLVYSAADSYDRAAPAIPTSSAMAKLFATETAQFVVDAAVQIHGAAGLERGHLLEHLY